MRIVKGHVRIGAALLLAGLLAGCAHHEAASFDATTQPSREATELTVYDTPILLQMIGERPNAELRAYYVGNVPHGVAIGMVEHGYEWGKCGLKFGGEIIRGGLVTPYTLLVPAATTALGAGLGLMDGIQDGYRRSLPPEKAEEIVRAFDVAANSVDMPKEIAAGMSMEDSASQSPMNHQAEMRLEYSLQHLGFSFANPSQTDKEVATTLYMQFQGRLVRIADGSEVRSDQFEWSTFRRRLFSEWLNDDSKLLREAIEQGYRQIGDVMAARLLDAYPALPSHAQGSYERENFCWGKAMLQEPDRGFRFFEWFSENDTRSNEFVGSRGYGVYLNDPQRFSDRQPLLAWEPFVDAYGSNTNYVLGPEISDVTYHLRIWEADSMRLIYEKGQLQETSHRVEVELEPGKRYLWSFRSEYRDGGAPKATHWAGSSEPVGVFCMSYVPEPNRFSFVIEERVAGR